MVSINACAVSVLIIVAYDMIRWFFYLIFGLSWWHGMFFPSFYHYFCSQAHGAWISFPPPPFLYYPTFFKIFTIIRFSSFDNISRRHTSWIIRVFCLTNFRLIQYTRYKILLVQIRGPTKGHINIIKHKVIA